MLRLNLDDSRQRIGEDSVGSPPIRFTTKIASLVLFQDHCHVQTISTIASDLRSQSAARPIEVRDPYVVAEDAIVFRYTPIYATEEQPAGRSRIGL
jgi:hypothetical protein